MISTLSGRVSEVLENSLVIEIGGVGLQVFAPMPLISEAKVGKALSLQTYLVVRETELSLYGFQGIEARTLFVLLLGVNGIGPRLALAILSTLSLESIRVAVTTEQSEILSQVPGVGKKTAQKIVLHLVDRLEPVEGAQAFPALREEDADLLEALSALGYTVVEAQSALQSIPKDASDELEERLRLALAFFTSPNK
jgi:Holliday junction DNA helicase RuvA